MERDCVIFNLANLFIGKFLKTNPTLLAYTTKNFNPIQEVITINVNSEQHWPDWRRREFPKPPILTLTRNLDKYPSNNNAYFLHWHHGGKEKGFIGAIYNILRMRVKIKFRLSAKGTPRAALPAPYGVEWGFPHHGGFMVYVWREIEPSEINFDHTYPMMNREYFLQHLDVVAADDDRIQNITEKAQNEEVEPVVWIETILPEIRIPIAFSLDDDLSKEIKIHFLIRFLTSDSPRVEWGPPTEEVLTAKYSCPIQSREDLKLFRDEKMKEMDELKKKLEEKYNHWLRQKKWEEKLPPSPPPS